MNEPPQDESQLRDYFAAHAMAAIIVANKDDLTYKQTLEEAYLYADEAMRARALTP